MHKPPRTNSTLWILLFAAATGLLLASVLMKKAEQQLYAELDRTGDERLNLYVSTVEAAHRRYDYLPYVMAEDQQIKQLLAAPTNPLLTTAVNSKLESWQSESHAAALYLMNHNGVVVAANNWLQPDSFVGRNYHFRPYFQQAIKGEPGRFFAVGVTTARPGLFLSRPITHEGKLLGVAVVKIDMTELEADWAAGGENVWITDQDSVIFLASNPTWKYRSLTQLSPQVLDRLDQERKYNQHSVRPLQLTALNNSPEGHAIIELRDKAATQQFLLHQRPIKGLAWQIYYLSDLKSLQQSKQSVILIAVLVASLLAVLSLFISSRLRHQQQLEQRVAQRTAALAKSNAQLTQEIEERSRAEQALRQTHEELIQAEKLAALGQMSAALVHEISQPLSAIQTFLASTHLLIERGETALVRENLDEIDKLIRRVSGIVSHLKVFASKSRGTLSRVQLQQVINNALLVLSPRLKKSPVQLIWQPPAHGIEVQADEIKLEQILVNLIRNALDATEHNGPSLDSRIRISLYTSEQHAHISIRDNGCGINPDDLPRLFDPFFTTKPPGEGLGLGLSVSYGIVEEFGGRLEVEPNHERGTTFRLTLSLAPKEPEHA